MLFFEDFSPGETRDFGSHEMTKAEIIAFASRFDPQDFHTDEEAAKASFAGGLIGSGWHSCSIMMRMMAEGFILGSASRGAPGIEEVRWLHPVRPGDVLTLRRHILDAKPSRSVPAMGLVRFRFELVNQRGEIAMDAVNWIMFTRRGFPHGPMPDQLLAPALYVPPVTLSPPIPPVSAALTPRRFFEDVQAGQRRELGSFRFTQDEILAFARPFDPQPFHLDAEAAKQSAFGGLCASGWHTVGIWMLLMMAARERLSPWAGEGPPPRLGTSPGFRNLLWKKPVFAGDVVTFISDIAQTRITASRPDWGLVFHHNTGVNQHGEEVFAFDGCVFWERRRER
jgi:acyl dehydratase